MEEKKTRRRPNFFDIVFILLILVVAVAAYFLSHDDASVQQVETTTRSYLVELTDLDANMADLVAVGDSVQDNVKNFSLGTVTNVEVVPSMTQVLDEDSEIIRMVPRGDRITLMLTIEAETTETDMAIQTVSGYPLRVGVSISCTVGGLTGSGYILAVDR